jgi:hypothetical protein
MDIAACSDDANGVDAAGRKRSDHSFEESLVSEVQ